MDQLRTMLARQHIDRLLAEARIQRQRAAAGHRDGFATRLLSTVRTVRRPAVKGLEAEPC